MAIKKVLVANRGEIARRVFRTCADRGIATVAVFAEPDADAPHVRDADEAVALSGETPSGAYLDITQIIDAAKRTGADAIHPGYGFLSENAGFARAVTDAGLTWIGPPPKAIEVMGSKLESKQLMESVGVPILQSIEFGDPSTVGTAAMSIGYPVLVKASAGGGGKGMRIVSDPAHLDEAIEGAQREAAGAFGDDTVFIEKYLEAPRHIEIQVFGDTHGNVISLHERECSIQRRHQKIIEESPSPVLTDKQRNAMGEAAVKAAEAVDYVGAGTVEFLFQDGEFHFLEMNTRLQVEHPVTEMVTGLDLVALQIDVANGEPLPDGPFPINGHAIEARLYAEDPLNDFLPVTGRFERFEFHDVAGLRVDSGVEGGSTVSPHFDPMLAKVIAHAPNRSDAAALLARGLRHARLHGSTTNQALLVRILEHDEFQSGDTDTHFLDRHEPTELGQPLAGPHDELVAATVSALRDGVLNHASAQVLGALPAGWRNAGQGLQSRAYAGTHGDHTIDYSTVAPFTVEGLGEVELTGIDGEKVCFAIDGNAHHVLVAAYGETRCVDGENGPVVLTVIPRFPSLDRDAEAGSLQAPMPGKVIRVDVAEGDEVEEGQLLVVMEAMKMEHTIRSPHGGTAKSVHVSADDQVESGTVLVVVDPA